MIFILTSTLCDTLQQAYQYIPEKSQQLLDFVRSQELHRLE